ncbi:hypothetical protein GOP47_0009871 [Adiantum capillus-veneris]|uniref:F-box domain-containing protein n=1 Tax=Adiantum capillus-veneris TaxID=13818 RepID=A0A9D4UX34_ADICA|nr:hypothetical protein GOP47_0009871 [Adiantum capillus-veneris]
METLTDAFMPQILAIRDQKWDWGGSGSWSNGYCFSSSPQTRNVAPQAVSHGSQCVGVDFFLSLPDELVEKILALLPISSIFRAGAVCTRWKAITSSRRFHHMCKGRALSAPWYFMYKESKDAEGLVYDPRARKWHSFSLPFISHNAAFVAASHGLACFADNSNGYCLYTCNPLTKACNKLPEPCPRWYADYCAVAITLDAATKEQTVVVARSNQFPGDYSHWNLDIEICSSLGDGWCTGASSTLCGWRGGENSVICNGVFYAVVHSTAMVGTREGECRQGLLSYNLGNGVLELASMLMPCALTCVKLINCNERLIMVGGIGKADIVRGIGVWELTTHWTEIARMPNKFFRGFGEFDDVFSSSGMGDLIYIHAFGSPQLLLYSLQHHTWRWSQKCPMVKKHPLHLFTGFCFEPRIDACP